MGLSLQGALLKSLKSDRNEDATESPPELPTKKVGEKILNKCKPKKKRRRRRGKNIVNNVNNSQSENHFSVLHMNCRGAPSKIKSIENIVANLSPEVITINEKNLKKNKTLKIRGYSSFCRNRVNGHMGGIATCVMDNDVKSTLKVTEGNDGNEFLITRHSQFTHPINIINIYGDVESRTKNDVIDDKWDEVLQEIVKIEARGEQILLIGDMNKHLGSLINKNHEKVSHGGKRIKEFIDNGDFVLINGSDKEINGPFTRYEVNDYLNDDKKSTLDIAIASRNLFKYVERFEIDKYRKWTPCRAVGKNTLKFSDHYSVLLIFNNIPRKEEKKISMKKPIIWNTKKKENWEKYFIKTNANSVLDEAVQCEYTDTNKLMNKIKREMANLKYSCFGKVSMSTISKEEKALQVIQKEKIESSENPEELEKVDLELANALDAVNKMQFEKEVNSLKTILKSKGKSAATFNLKERILGDKKRIPEPTVVEDPTTGYLVDSPSKIKDVSLKYCKTLLTNRKPNKGYEDVTNYKRTIHEIRMKEKVPNDDEELTYDVFMKVIEKVKRKNGEKYKFLVNAGYSLLNALFVLFKLVWKTEQIPNTWHTSELIQLFKGRGLRSSLENWRFLHIKDDISKMFSQIVFEKTKECLISGMTKYQIATKPGHRATEHVYCVMSLIQLNEDQGKALLLSLFDVQKFFDKESIYDIHYELYKSSIKGKLYRLMFNLNKNIKIKVKTPVGTTAATDTGPGMGQGTVMGAIESSLSLDSGVKEFFHANEDDKDKDEDADDKIDDVKYDDVVIKPLLFQDDIFNAAKSVKEAQKANKKLEVLMESKLLNFHTTKSVFLVAGRKKVREKLQEEVITSPLMLCNTTMKQVEAEKYLGCWIASTTADSVSTTVKKRIGVATKAIFEARAVIEDSRANVIGGITLAFQIWEASVIPNLLFGSETWTKITRTTMKSLDDLAKKFLKVTLGLGNRGTQVASMFWATASMTMENRILQSKLIFMHHLATLPHGSLANEFYQIQSVNPYPSIVNECKEYLKNWNIENIEQYNKYRWKILIRKKIVEKNRLDLLSQMEGFKKIDYEQCKSEELKIKGYFKSMNVADARLAFKIENFVVPTVKLNFKSDKQFKAEGYLCSDCRVELNDSDISNNQPVTESRAEVRGTVNTPGKSPMFRGFLDNQSHILNFCKSNVELRRGKNLDELSDQVTLFKEVVSRRNRQTS